MEKYFPSSFLLSFTRRISLRSGRCSPESDPRRVMAHTRAVNHPLAVRRNNTAAIPSRRSKGQSYQKPSSQSKGADTFNYSLCFT